MGKLITWLVALIVLGAAVWFLFLRDATDKAAEKAQDPVKTVEKIQNEEVSSARRTATLKVPSKESTTNTIRHSKR